MKRSFLPANLARTALLSIAALSSIIFSHSALAGSMTVPDAHELLDVYIEASSTLWEDGYDYGSYNLLDYSLSAIWAEGAYGSGYGEYLDYYIPEGTAVTGGIIYTGFCKSEDLFLKNGAPSSLVISSGTTSATLNLYESASTYATAASGYSFSFDPPIVSNGVVRVSIQDVREGWKYADACISELRFTGGTPAYTSAGSTAGGYGSSPVTDSWRQKQRDWLYWLFLHHTRYSYGNGLVSLDLPADSLSSHDKAFVLYHCIYHSSYDDARVSRTGQYQEYNRIAPSDAWDIWSGFFTNISEADKQAFIDDFVVYQENGYFCINGTGDFGASGPYLFDSAAVLLEENGYLVLEGSVYTADGRVGDGYPKDILGAYRAYYRNVPGPSGSRYLLDTLSVRKSGDAMPWPTLSQNSVILPAGYESASSASGTPLSPDDLAALALDYFEREHSYRPAYADSYVDTDGKIVIHLYDIIQDGEYSHTATSAWYRVGSDGTGVDELMNTPINLHN